MRSIIFGLVVVVLSSLATTGRGALILETATLGPTYGGGSSIGSQFLGARFSLNETHTITGIGGYFRINAGSIWGAIIALPGPGSLPGFDPIDIEANALTFALFDAPTNDVQIFMESVNVDLSPGDYAIVLGGGTGTGGNLFGANGFGAMQSGTSLPGASFLVTRGFSFEDPIWGNGPFDAGWAFFVEGNVVPEPTTFIVWSLLGTLALTAGWWRRRK